MASLTVRQLDEKLKKRLRLRAAKSGRSVEDEVRTILREALTRCEEGKFHTICHKQLVEDSRHVVLHGELADSQAF